MVKKFDPVQSKWALQIISDNYISQTVVQLQYSMKVLFSSILIMQNYMEGE